MMSRKKQNKKNASNYYNPATFKNFDVHANHSLEERLAYQRYLHHKKVIADKKERGERAKAKRLAYHKQVIANRKIRRAKKLAKLKKKHEDRILYEMNRAYKKHNVNDTIMNIKVDYNRPIVNDIQGEYKKLNITYLGDNYRDITIHYLYNSLKGDYKKRANKYLDKIQSTYIEDYDEILDNTVNNVDKPALYNYLINLSKSMDKLYHTNSMEGLEYELHRNDLIVNGQYAEHQASVYQDAYVSQMTLRNFDKRYIDAIKSLTPEQFVEAASISKANRGQFGRNALLPIINEFYEDRDNDTIQSLSLDIAKGLRQINIDKFGKIFNNEGYPISNELIRSFKRTRNRYKYEDYENYYNRRKEILSNPNDNYAILEILELRNKLYDVSGREFIHTSKSGHKYIPFTKREVVDAYIKWIKNK